MYRKFLVAVALSGLALPALALASQPLLVRFDGHVVPMQETVQVTRTPAGRVQVHTWTWHGPDGALTMQVSESRGAGAPPPAWALTQMRELRMEMQQLNRIEAALEQPLLVPSPPIPVVLSEPMLLPLPGLAPPPDMHVLQWVIVPRALVLAPFHALVSQPLPPHTAPAAPMRHHGVVI